MQTNKNHAVDHSIYFSEKHLVCSESICILWNERNELPFWVGFIFPHFIVYTVDI